jgi:two-component system, sensor histidine kinase
VQANRGVDRWLDHFAQIARLDTAPLLTEQLKLVCSGVTLSLLPMFPAMALLVWVLHDSTDTQSLLLWFVALGANNGHMIYGARRYVRLGFPPHQARAIVARLTLSIAVGGLAWGMLAWSTLGNTSLGGNILVIGVLAGILGGAISLLSPVPVLFVVLAFTLVGTTALRLWQIDDPGFNAFGVISLMYLAVMLMHSRNAYLMVKESIELRFANLELAQKAEAARLQAVEANTAKSKFLAAASHDLRQPIHAQGLFLEVLASTQLTPLQDELLRSLSESRNSTAEMLDVLLDFSRIEAGVVQPQAQAFAVLPMLNRLEREFGIEADAKGLTYRSRETSLVLFADPSLVELILRNLIANAIRYTERGGLLVTCRRRGDQALLEVRDTGIGIAPDQQQAVFQEFHQLANPERDSRKGLGLGLAIADGLARAMGTKLALKSQPSVGSRFSFLVPIAATLDFASVPIASNQTESPANSAASAPAVLDGPKQIGGDTSDLLGLQVLLVDDEPSIRSAMRTLLQSWGCVCEAAESIEQALVLLQSFSPQILVCDYRLREHRSGAQAIQAIRAAQGWAIPSIIITGDTAPERLREASSFGVPLLHKPVSPQKLRDAMLAASAHRMLPNS